jgi:hypothetical protein
LCEAKHLDFAGYRIAAFVQVDPGQVVLMEMNKANAVPFSGFISGAGLSEGSPSLGVCGICKFPVVRAIGGLGPFSLFQSVAPNNPLIEGA